MDFIQCFVVVCFEFRKREKYLGHQLVSFSYLQLVLLQLVRKSF